MKMNSFNCLKVKNITMPGERSAAGLSDASRIWIVEVSGESPAINILQSNDVIVQINRVPVRNYTVLGITL